MLCVRTCARSEMISITGVKIYSAYPLTKSNTFVMQYKYKTFDLVNAQITNILILIFALKISFSMTCSSNSTINNTLLLSGTSIIVRQGIIEHSRRKATSITTIQTYVNERMEVRGTNHDSKGRKILISLFPKLDS